LRIAPHCRVVIHREIPIEMAIEEGENQNLINLGVLLVIFVHYSTQKF